MFELASQLFVEESFVRFYGVRLATRMAVVVLPERKLFVYSPVLLEPASRRQLDALGDVSFVVSPNKIHNQSLSEYQRVYPNALYFAPPGLVERRPDVRFTAELDEEVRSEWRGEIDQTLTRGNVFFSEALFFHRRSRTLLVGDLVENLGPGSMSRLGFALARILGATAGPGASPEFRYYTHDAEAARVSLEVARGWDFERIFLCHGTLICRDARSVFASVCERLLDEVRHKTAFSRWATSRMAALQ